MWYEPHLRSILLRFWRIVVIWCRLKRTDFSGLAMMLRSWREGQEHRALLERVPQSCPPVLSPRLRCIYGRTDYYKSGVGVASPSFGTAFLWGRRGVSVWACTPMYRSGSRSIRMPRSCLCVFPSDRCGGVVFARFPSAFLRRRRLLILDIQTRVHSRRNAIDAVIFCRVIYHVMFCYSVR